MGPPLQMTSPAMRRIAQKNYVVMSHPSMEKRLFIGGENVNMEDIGGAQALQGVSLVSPSSSSQSVCFKSDRKQKTMNRVASHYEEFRYPTDNQRSGTMAILRK